ncbi:Rieske 2Fe-2S domain-containing protein [Aureibacter tunicatorum]|uniref:DMSO/TMAO reductase YedYZ heme-binding membrane subunit/nitrite reductase/ring-hydroxylating ferredoxin subunit n=1 Tax=Aureibacter tunicatorum TaxID=866807 RepID=A0AAE3XNW9_9BACT|nr:Rieske 2Fe-2S domain-containing protein [Aureibacter tunicatorum]MDR6239354.1 DMSO/TMAO reductase YedYZ heme-binding membrane subunit/nitrite reductase/ring-hydroxylating ferredoxin subunit [Aureibacter tunicatorum]BDD04723.1 hypothetical protein AUTU_22060 [Aureibacter tunicatorum]
MSVGYVPVQWNRFKKLYDKIIFAFVILYVVGFTGFSLVFNPNITVETLMIRASGTLAFLMLTIILSIGPLTRINRKFLPLLYNRRHLGVSMFTIGLIHGALVLYQFHALGNVNPLFSLFFSNLQYNSFANFPFQVLGFIALMIFYVMFSTSHDFWLKNLSPKTWKLLHMLVYVSYFLIIGHVVLGAFQQEKSLWIYLPVSLSVVMIALLHVWSAILDKKIDNEKLKGNEEFLYACRIGDIDDNRAKIVFAGEERVAIFKYEGKLAAVSNVCKHQNGPIGEGKVVKGCITCPWHGYQYQPNDGCSPPPFDEKISTYQIKLVEDAIYIHPRANEEGMEQKPIEYEKGE